MSPELASILPYLLIAALIFALAAWLLLRGSKKTDVIREDDKPARDVLDEGAAPAARNQALIDATPAAANNLSELEKTSAPPEPATSPAPAPAVTPTMDAPPAPAEAPAAPPPSAPEAPSEPASGDDLSQIKGVGPKLVKMLQELGITQYSQIAGWSEADVERIDAELGRFAGRITRDQWIEQAKLLMQEDKSEFEAKFGNK